MIDPIDLATRLINIPSPTGEEGNVGLLLERELEAIGFHCRRHQVDGDRFNLLATTAARPRVLMNSHLDTVPPWFAAREDGEWLFGRGACDTKGIIAAMVAAAESLLAEGVREFGILLVVAEETDSIGAKMASRELADIGSEWVIVGEPTDSTFVRASKGALTCTLRFDGIAAHSAYPHLGRSAIQDMARAIRAIDEASWPRDEDLGETTANVGVVRGGEKPNVIAPWAEADLIFRTACHPDLVRQMLADMVAPLHGRIVYHHGNPPQRMFVPDGQPSQVVAFNTDVPHLAPFGTPLLFGPGSILDAHSAEEKISRAALLSAVTTYRDLVLSLLARV